MQDIIGELPDCTNIDFLTRFNTKSYDVLIQAIGFETRTVAFAEKLSNLPSFKVKETILIKYMTNIEDNLFFEEKILSFLEKFSTSISFFNSEDDFTVAFNQKIVSLRQSEPLNILMDISSFSSGMTLSLMRILLFSKNNLFILYTEGLVYHPTESEYEKIQQENSDDHALYQTKGIEKVKISFEYSGGTKENQDLVISFPSFRSERTESIIAYIDELILKQQERKRIIWVIGEPNMEDGKKERRMEIQKKLNGIKPEDKTYSISTLDYKKTLLTLDHIYNEEYTKYHINISDLGSKMQTLGIALFANLRRDVSVFYAEPKKYNPLHYSEGIKNYWIIEFGSTDKLLETLFKVDLILERIS